MNLLLDTHVLLWFISGDEKLGDKALEAILDDANTVYISTVSIQEIAIKVRIGKLAIDLEALAEQIESADFERLDFDCRHALVMAGIEQMQGHKDPFDIMLVAQAVADNLTVVTADARMEPYPMRIIRCKPGRQLSPSTSSA